MRLVNADPIKFGTIIDAVLDNNNFPIIKETNVSDLPTAYDVDGVVEQLKEVFKRFCNSVDCNEKSMCEDCEQYIMFKKNIEIVRAGGLDDSVKSLS